MSGTNTHSTILSLFTGWRRIDRRPYRNDAELLDRLEVLEAIEHRMRDQRPATVQELAAVVMVATRYGQFGLDRGLAREIAALAEGAA